jgi:hypothetical protein
VSKEKTMPTKTEAPVNGKGVRAGSSASPAADIVERDSEVISEQRDGEVEGSKRRMPDNLRRYLLRMQGGKMYLPAAYRIVWFRDELGDEWGIRTNLVEGGHEAGFATMHAEILNPEGRVIASGHKTEAKSDFPAGWVEKAESGAVARALALLGFGTQFTPELDDDGHRPADSPQPRYASATQAPREDRPVRTASTEPAAVMAVGTAVQEIWPGPGQCPKCHAPEGKKHGRQCLGL